MRTHATVLVALAALVASLPAAAAPPANDAFAAAETLLGASGSVPGSTLEASVEPGEPAYYSVPVAGSVWYRWTAPYSGAASFGIPSCQHPHVFSGGTLAELAAVQPRVEWWHFERGCGTSVPLVAGTTYRIAVVADEAAARGDFTLRWESWQKPANDDFASGRPLSGLRGGVAGTTAGSSREAGEPPHDGYMSSVWFRWRPPRPMRAVFDACGGDSPQLRIYRGASLASLRFVAAGDRVCRVSFHARRDVLYHVAVTSVFVGAGTQFRLRWEPDACRVPRLRGRSLARAREDLEGAGCALARVRSVPSLLVPRGFVVAQWPAPGRRLAPFGRVHLAVSSGRPPR